MSLNNRRQFLRSASAVAALATLPASIRRALAVPAFTKTGTIEDVKHVVILMQENRSFDHYFGTMKGVRGFGDRHPIPLESGKSVWHQSDGDREISPFHLDTKITSGLRVPGTPHSFSDSQAAWNQGKFGFWPKFKTQYSMGHYKREDIPFQFALADAFTICDAYHCSVTTGTDPNRIVFWSGSNFNPELRARGENCTDADSEPNNLRCWVKGALPTPGYVYQGSAFKWATIPDVLQRAGITWRFYQDPNDNWTGAMHGCLAFESFRSASKESPQYRNGMSHWSLEQLAQDVQNDALPQVSWVLPPANWSEHPSRSTPLQGAEFTARVLNALTANPEVWSKTVFILTFDENDGQFDHVPPPAVPSFNLDGSLAGKSTLDLGGEYFAGAEGEYVKPEDTISGSVRPWGLGPRVPLYVISPWSKGGWVNSQVFDHTSVGQFLETRFGIKISSISPWHRVVSGDLTSAFDFVSPNNPVFPKLPDVSDSVAVVAEHIKRPKPIAPDVPGELFQELGTRPSRALPYVLHVQERVIPGDSIALEFHNSGKQGVVFHVYDKLHLDRIPRRYTVEASKSLTDAWNVSKDEGEYNLWVYGPNGFLREFKGNVPTLGSSLDLETKVAYDPRSGELRLLIKNSGLAVHHVKVVANAYDRSGPWTFSIESKKSVERRWSLAETGNWYDLTVRSDAYDGYSRRFAGRMETGKHSVSDPAIGIASSEHQDLGERAAGANGTALGQRTYSVELQYPRE